MVFLSLYYTHKPGGLCKRLYRLLGALSAEHEAIYLALDKPPVQIAGFRKLWFPLQSRSGALFWVLFGFFSAVQAAIQARRRRVDVLIAFHPIYALLLYPAALISGAKLALFFRAVPHKVAEVRGEALKAQFLKLSEHLAVLVSERVFLISEAMLNELLFIHREKVVLVPNDIPKGAHNFGDSLVIDSQKFSILTSGVFDVRKNAGVLIEAINQLPAGLKEKVVVYLVGAGPELSALSKRVHDLGLSDRFIFSGWIENFQLPKVSLVVHPSIHEGFSNSLLEALARKVPVLASNIPEHSEFLPQSGLFNNSAELCALIESAVTDQAFIERLTREQSEVRNKLSFDWEGRIISGLNIYADSHGL